MTFFVDALIKATLLLLLVFGLAFVSKRASAATRHLVWCFGLVGLLLLPILTATIPWHWGVLPTVEGVAVGEPIPTGAPEAVVGDGSSAVVTRSADVDEAGMIRLEPVPGADGASAAGTGDRILDAESARSFDGLASRIDLWGILITLWLLGTTLIMMRLAVGMFTLRRYSRRSRPATGTDWELQREWARSRLLLDTPVRILLSEDVAMPLTAGVFRPLVLMPAATETWSANRRRAVLLHEMAHIKRRDILPHLLAWIVCALWWFHPLVWSAARRMRSESERACDDLVLKIGTRPSHYADDLLDIVTRAGTARAPAVVVPLAQRSEFEGRILAILAPDRKRHGVSLAQASMVAAVVALCAVPLAAMGPGRPASPPANVESAPGEDGASILAIDPIETDEPKEDSVSETPVSTFASPVESSEEVESTDAMPSEPEIEIAAEGGSKASAQDPKDAKAIDGRAVAAVAGRLGDKDPRVRLSAAETLGKLEDPRAVAALSRALRQDPDAKVRRMAAWALGRIEDPAAVPALSAALREDEDAGVRLAAAEALGDIEDAAAVEPLGEALRDPSVEVRRAAVEALGDIEDARAVPLVLPFLKDADVQVRRNAAHALGHLESPQAVDALIEATRDSDLEVRVNAIEALGDIEDPRALPALLAALRDDAVVVRREAVDAIGNLDLRTAPQELIDAVRDPDREVRLEAVDALGNIEDPAAVPVLLEIVRTSPDRELQYEALDALSDIESPAAYDALIPLLEHEDPKIRQLAAEAIGDMQ